MCGAFNLEDDIIGYLKSYGYLFDLDDEAELKPGDFFPNGNSLILRGKESPKAEAMRWYYALGDGKTNVFNCRSESIFEKKMFSTSITNRRCIIPVSHYYEWMGEKGKKEKYEIEIEKIYVSNNYDNKSMLIKVTDEKLLEKTRGNNSRNEWFSYNTKWKICAEQ